VSEVIIIFWRVEMEIMWPTVSYGTLVAWRRYTWYFGRNSGMTLQWHRLGLTVVITGNGCEK
jgi:hypothetical protein